MSDASKVSERVGQKANGDEKATSSSPVRRSFESLRREVDRIFDEFGGEFWRSPFRRLSGGDSLFRRELTAGNAPAVDIFDSHGAFEVTADVPGFDDSSIEIEVVNGSLWIKGERRSERAEKEDAYYLSERAFGSFQRCFRLPDGIDTDRIEASLKKGVLTVILPKTSDSENARKKIEIRQD